MDVIKAFFEMLAASSVVVAGAVWLIRKISERFFDRDLEKFKSSLEREAIQFRVRYEKLHTERAIVIKEIYKRIAKVHIILLSLTNPGKFTGEPPIAEQEKEAAEAINDLVEFYEENRVFLEESLGKEIDNLIRIIRDSWYTFQFSQQMRSTGETGAGDKRFESWKLAKDEIPKVKRVIETKFRGILGIED